MKIYKEVEQIMRHYDEIEYLIDRLSKKNRHCGGFRFIVRFRKS